MSGSVVPDQTPHLAFDQGLHCLFRLSVPILRVIMVPLFNLFWKRLFRLLSFFKFFFFFFLDLLIKLFYTAICTLYVRYYFIHML